MPLPLLRGTARFDRIAAGHILVARAPLPPTHPVASSDTSFSLPHLPVAVELGTLSVPAIDLGPSLLGEPASFTLAGAASLHEGAAGASLSLVRTGAAQGAATIKLTLDDKQLSLDLQATDQSGELLAKLDPDAGAQPLTLTLKGQGPLSGWTGRLDGASGGGSKLGADLSLALDRGWAASIKGTAEVASLLAEQVRPTAGEQIGFDVAATGPKDKPIILDHADIRMAAGTIAAKGSFDPVHQAIDATATVKGDIHTLEGIAGEPVTGTFQLDLGLKGERGRPTASILFNAQAVSAGDNGVSETSARLDLVTGADDQLHITGGGKFSGIKAAGAPPPDALGDTLDWTIDLTSDRTGGKVQLGKATASGAGIQFDASGKFNGTAVDGKLHLIAADLSRFAGLAGIELAGGVTVDGTVGSPDGKAIDAKLNGRLTNLKTGIAQADGLFGPVVTVDAVGGRTASGGFTLGDLTIKGSDLGLTGKGTFDPATQKLDGKAALTLPRLAAIGPGYAGQATVTATATGQPKDPAMTVVVDGSGIEAGSRKIDRVLATATLASLVQRSVTLTAKLTAGALNATLDGTVAQTGDQAYAVKALKLDGPGTKLAADLTIDLAAKRGAGTATGSVTDLVVWAPLAGLPLGGAVKFSGKLTGANATLDADVSHLSIGAGAADQRTTLDHLTAKANLTDVWTKPRGTLALDVNKLGTAGASVSQAKLTVATDKSGAFGFTLDGAGTRAKAVPGRVPGHAGPGQRSGYDAAADAVRRQARRSAAQLAPPDDAGAQGHRLCADRPGARHGIGAAGEARGQDVGLLALVRHPHAEARNDDVGGVIAPAAGRRLHGFDGLRGQVPSHI